MVTTASRRLAVIDDSSDNRMTLMAIARSAGYEPFEIAAATSFDALVARVSEQASAALTDLRLQESWDVSYNGAELAHALFLQRIPTILVSEYAGDDADTVIRTHRKYLPEVLRADAVTSADELRTPLQLCIDEIAGHVPPHRRPWRALMRVTAQFVVRGEMLIEVVIPEWDSVQPVRLPLSLIPSDLHTRMSVGCRLFSQINTDARTSEELFFDGFELAPGVNS